MHWLIYVGLELFNLCRLPNINFIDIFFLFLFVPNQACKLVIKTIASLAIIITFSHFAPFANDITITAVAQS